MAVVSTPHASEARSVRRKQGDLVLTGRGGYLDDVQLPHMLHAAILRSSRSHARLLDVDASQARRMAGVRYVMAGREALEHVGPLPHFFDPGAIGANTTEFRCLAVDKVSYEGEAIAVVVAESVAQAEAARDAITVSYDPLPAVIDTEAALAPDAPLVYPDWGTNVLCDVPFAEGDPDAVFATAPHVLADRITIQRYNTAPMEPRGYVAAWGIDGRLTLWASTQNPHPLRTNLANTLDMSESMIRVVATRLGGGFGHKFHGYPEEPLLCALSRLVSAPVKWIETRADSMMIGGREYVHDFDVAFDDNGRILAFRDRVLGNIGALGTLGGWGMAYVAGMTFPGPYKIKHYEVHAVPVVTNKPPWNGTIGYGKESTALALERMIELIAGELELESADVRRTNFIPADEFPYWTRAKRLDSGNYEGALNQLLELGDYAASRREQSQARDAGRLFGVGIGFELTPEGGDFPGTMSRGYDTSTVRIDPRGDVVILTGVTSPGTGNETGIAQVVAAELTLPVDAITVLQGDTDRTPYGYGNFSSRGMNVGGGSALLAARELRGRMQRAAAVLLECEIGELELADGAFVGAAGKLSFAEVAHAIYKTSGAVPGLNEHQLEATATWGPSANMLHTPDEEGRTSSYPTYPYSAHLAVLEVDPDTGVVKLHKFCCVHDCGVVINHAFVDGQLYGSIAMGIGGALLEELPYDSEGHLQAHTFKEYLTPRATDLPPIVLGAQETPSPFTLLGTKGAGESGVSGSLAAVANAVNDALAPIGVRVHDMPLSPPRLLTAIRGAAAR